MLLLSLLFFALSVAQPCNQQTTCGTCHNATGCGWCWSAQKCLPGDASGPQGSTCLSYSWKFGPSSICPDDPNLGCGAKKSCGECNKQDQACGWCSLSGVSSCVVIDQPGGASSQCRNAVFNGVVKKTCGCTRHSDCLQCQSDPDRCQWCLSEQLCLPSNGDAQCKGLTVIQGNCKICSQFTGCVACSEQPGCTYCDTSQGGNTALACTATSACNGTKLATCSEECARSYTCEGCLKMQDCAWKNNKCVGRVNGQPHQMSCPIPSGFDAGSFVGGMFLIIGLVLLAFGGFMLYSWYHRRHHSSNLVVQ